MVPGVLLSRTTTRAAGRSAGRPSARPRPVIPAADQPVGDLRVLDAGVPLANHDVPVSRGRTMHVTILGPVNGRPTVALHGLGGSTDQNLPALTAVSLRYDLRIYAIDLPNHGRSGTVGMFHFQVRQFSALIAETVRALDIEPTVLIGHSFGGQLAALLASDLAPQPLQPIFINPAIGAPWDSKLRRCWRQPWRFLRLVQELGYDDSNVDRNELYHARRLLQSILDMLLDRELKPYRRLQATLALLLNDRTAGILDDLGLRGIRPVIVQGMLDRSTPALDDVHLVDGFHSWLHEADGPRALLAALDKVFPGQLP
jgi:pimeloyl-ACP methyl ester carboxylesterase